VCKADTSAEVGGLQGEGPGAATDTVRAPVTAQITATPAIGIVSDHVLALLDNNQQDE
jgi:hypothetical protein